MSTGNSKSSSRRRETFKDNHLLLETLHFGQWFWKMTGLGQSFSQETYKVMRNNWVSCDFNCNHIKNYSLELQNEFPAARAKCLQLRQETRCSLVMSSHKWFLGGETGKGCAHTKELVQKISHIQLEKLTARNEGHYSNSASVIDPFGWSRQNSPVSN